MRSIIRKWGNSLALRIPKAVSDDLNMKCDTEVEIIMKDGCLVLRPQTKKYSLRELLSLVTEENLHEEISTGDRAGREEW